MQELNDEAGSEKAESKCNLRPVGLDYETNPGKLRLGEIGASERGQIGERDRRQSGGKRERNR